MSDPELTVDEQHAQALIDELEVADVDVTSLQSRLDAAVAKRIELESE